MVFGGFFLAAFLVELLLEFASLLAGESALELETLLALVAEQHVLQTLRVLIQIHLDPATSPHQYKSTVCPCWAVSPKEARSVGCASGMPVNIAFLSFPKYYKNSFTPNRYATDWALPFACVKGEESKEGRREESEEKNTQGICEEKIGINHSKQGKSNNKPILLSHLQAVPPQD